MTLILEVPSDHSAKNQAKLTNSIRSRLAYLSAADDVCQVVLPGGPLRVDQLEVVLPVLGPAVVGRRVEVLAGLLVRVLHRQRHLAASDGQNLK